MNRALRNLCMTLTLLAAGLAMAGALHRPKAWMPESARGTFAAIDGVPIRYLQAGTGPDILLIHGCPGSVEDWDPIFETLSKKYRVTAYDRPGFGYSGARTDYSLAHNARVAQGLIQKLGLKDVLIVGHSYGAGTGLAMAVQNAPNVRGYVLIGCPGYAPVNYESIYDVLSLPALGDGLATLAIPVIGPTMVRKGVLRGFGPNAEAIPAGFTEARIKLWAQPKVAVTRARELTGLERELVSMSRYYGNIHANLWLVQGELDDITKAAWKLHADIPGSKLMVLPGIGHYPQYARPQSVLDAIDSAIHAQQEL